MISCREASELVSRSLDEPLPWSRRLGLRLHLAMCSLCRRFDTQLRFLRAACQAYPGAGTDRRQQDGGPR